MPGWVLFALASAFFAGLTAVLAKLGVAGVDSNLATLVRTAVILVFSAAIVLGTRAWQNPLRLPSRTLVFLALSGLTTGASWLCYFRALQIGPASRVAPVDKLGVVFAVVLAVLFLGESLNWKLVLGLALVVAGGALVALS
ncbi:MAG: EamA family transporter [Candidatus Nanopelagicales bacterium]